MKSRWLIAVVLSLHFTGICSQNNSPSLFLKHYGFVDDPYLIMYIAKNITTPDSTEIINLANYFIQNRAEILNHAEMSTLHSLYIDPKRIEITPEIRQKANEMMASMGQAILSGIADYQEQQARQAQLEAQRKAQLQEQHNRSMEIAMQNRAKQVAQQNSSYTTTSSTPLYSSVNHTQSNNYKMETSDIDSYMAIQMSNNAYGTQATQEALNQQRQNDYENSQNGGYGGQVIQAVMSNGRAIKIQVRSGKVVAYSTGVQGRTQNWAPVTGGIFKTTGVGSSLEVEYSHKTSFYMGNSNVTVYFNL